jgi:hypothetical protein
LEINKKIKEINDLPGSLKELMYLLKDASESLESSDIDFVKWLDLVTISSKKLKVIV